MTLYQIMDFIFMCMGLFFDSLDSVYLGEYAYLDILCALAYLRITIWFIMRVLNPHEGDNNKE